MIKSESDKSESEYLEELSFILSEYLEGPAHPSWSKTHFA